MQIAGWLSEPCKTESGRIVGVFEAELVRKTKRISHGKRSDGWGGVCRWQKLQPRASAPFASVLG